MGEKRRHGDVVRQVGAGIPPLVGLVDLAGEWADQGRDGVAAGVAGRRRHRFAQSRARGLAPLAWIGRFRLCRIRGLLCKARFVDQHLAVRAGSLNQQKPRAFPGNVTVSLLKPQGAVLGPEAGQRSGLAAGVYPSQQHPGC